MLNTIPNDTLITFTKLWRDNSCVSITPGIVQNLNMATKKLVFSEVCLLDAAVPQAEVGF